MTKEEMVLLLRSAGVDDNAVNLAINAWEMGVECERQNCLAIVESYDNGLERNYAGNIADAINARGNK